MKNACLRFALLFGAVLTIPNLSTAQLSKGHWELVQGDPFPDSVTQVVAAAGDVVYMATSDGGIFKSTDRGENWITVNAGLNGDLNVLLLAIGPKGDLLAATALGKIYYSADGETWTEYQTGDMDKRYPNARIASLTFDANDSAYFGTIGAGIYRLARGSALIAQVIPPALIPGAEHMLFDAKGRLVISDYEQAHGRNLWRLGPNLSTIEHTWAGKSGRLWKSTWGDCLVQGDLLLDDTLYGLGDSLYAITDWGFYLAENVFGDLIVDSTGKLYAMRTWSSFPWRSTDQGRTWNEYKNPHDDNGPDYYRAATSWGFISGFEDHTISVSYDTGMTWKHVHQLDSHTRISQIALDANGNLQAADYPDFVYSGGYWSSTDHGTTWRQRMNHLYIQGHLMEDGKYYYWDYANPTPYSLYVSEDGGMTYQPVNIPIGLFNGLTLYVSPKGTLWLSYGNAHFMRSTDRGATWKEFAYFKEPGPFYCCPDSAVAIGIIEQGPDIWLATAKAIHFTSDDGATWQVDTTHYVFTGMSAGKGQTIITHTSNEGIHWLNPGENPDSSWIDWNGPFAEDLGGNLLQFQKDLYGGNDTETFVRVSKSGINLETLAITPDSLEFSDVSYQSPATLAIDSLGNIFATTDGSASSGNLQNTTYGLYHFVPANASINHHLPPSGDLDVSVSNDVLSIISPVEIRSAELIDVAGRSILIMASRNSTTLSSSVALVPSGVYLVKVGTGTGDVVRKIVILR